MAQTCPILILLFLSYGPTAAQSAEVDAPTYGDYVSRLSVSVLKPLASGSVPDESGAIGRNRQKYFHVRFQLGMHRVAQYGLAAEDHGAVNRFVSSVEYSFKHQKPTGDFQITVPDSLKHLGKPREADLASGIAFFAASLGEGWLALESNERFQNSSKVADHRARLEKLKPKLQLTLQYLMKQRQTLMKVDGKAPNRLLFDAIALYSGGKLVGDKNATEAASEFADAALNQVHANGYFIEGGGYDSSYNGVATALALHLLMMGYDDDRLPNICRRAIDWQCSRITAEGEIETTGNARVNPEAEGESFLGRKKDVDVGHTLEALMLASVYFRDSEYLKVAARVLNHYDLR